MVWTKIDFEREVRRQLVEIESIRKRLPESPEVHERIDRLEASHRHLIRKLDEVFPASSKPPKLAPAPPAHQGTSKRAPKRTHSHGRLSFHVHATLSKKKVTVPGIHEKCAACGKVLLASVILGREVVFLNEAWYHRSCASKGSLN
jgi:hypothetical protein